jgi:hypothetical protein
MNIFRRISYGAAVGMMFSPLSSNCHAQSQVAEQSIPEVPEASAAPAQGPAEQEPDEARDFCRCIGDTDSPSVSKINRALRGPLHSQGLDFVESPLEEVANFLQDDYGIPIQLDLSALEEIGLSRDEKVTVNLHNISLKSALRLMLKQLGLTSMIRNEVLMITTPEEAETHLETCVYDVNGLVDDTSRKNIEALVDTIISCVATETWADNGGGEAEIRVLQPGLLVISQTQTVQNAVRDLLTEIREMRRAQSAGDEATAQANATRDKHVVTRTYYLQIERGDKLDVLERQLRELVVQSIPDERWNGQLDDGQGVVLTVLPDRIVVRHNESVHEKVEDVLVESGVATLTDPKLRGVGFGGGGLAPSRDDR